MKPGFRLSALSLGLLLYMGCMRPVSASETVSFSSGAKTLHGLIYKPAGTGPFPAVLYNHGSAPGMLNNEAFDSIGPLFVARGWVFFAPYRRGQGLSSDAGPYIMAEINAARAQGGDALAAKTMVRLLGAERGNYCAAVDASGGAESWDKAPDLQELMLRAVTHAKAPILFFQAENDFSLIPSRTLYAAMQSANRPAEIRIYPPYGHSPKEGHSFAYRGARVWIEDVMRFLDASCQPAL